MAVWSMPVLMVWSVSMSLHQDREPSVDHVQLATLMMETSVQVCANDIHDPIFRDYGSRY